MYILGGAIFVAFSVNIISPRGMFDYFSGLAHLWFLPMLFWVFMLFFFLKNKTSLGMSIVIPLILISIVVPNVESLGILSSLHYLVWFVCGYYTFIFRDRIKYFPRISMLLIFVFLIILFLSYVEVRPSMNKLREMGLMFKMIFQIVEHSVLLPISIAGISFVYFFSIWLTAKFDFSISRDAISKVVSLLSKYSMGIYIFHDFIIEGLYKKTDFLNIFHLYSPWLAYLFSIVFSILLSKLVLSIPYLRKTI